MDREINLNQIIKFSKTYNQNEMNKMVEKEISKKGIREALIDKEIIKENKHTFNIELPDTKRQDQEKSHRCWIYAGLNTLKHDIAKKLNINVYDFELSSNYIAFFDRLEKSNKAYENAINLKQIDFDYINKENIFRYCGNEGGRWEYFQAIVNKYGVVSKSVMPDTYESNDYEQLERIYTEKIVKDILKIFKLKEENISINEIRKTKEKFLEENYSILSKILGEPKSTFTYEYIDVNNKKQILEEITPLQFKEKFLKLKLEDFISIENMPMYNKEYYKIYKKKYIGYTIENSSARFLNLPIDEIKELVIKQLKDNIPVFFGVNVTKFKDNKSGVLDTRLYNIKEKLGIDTLTKEEALNMYNIRFHHAMIFCGAQIEENTPVRWKIEDSYGDKDRYNGYYIMNDNFFDKFVINVIIHKKYLNTKQINALKQNSILIETEEPG